MKFALCLFAFLLGCISTVFVRDTPAETKLTSDVLSARSRLFKPVLTLFSTEMNVSKTSFGATSDGDEVTKYTCQNSHGYAVELIDYGATVVAFNAPDRKGQAANITLGCNDMAAYEANQSYLGATVGRYCNRIANGKFFISEEEFTLPINNGENHLHGGPDGFDSKIWQAETLKRKNSVGVRFSTESPDGEGGYPGRLKVFVDYVLNNDNELIVEFHASTDKPTHLNLTNHCYWNLSGAGVGTVGQHVVKINAKKLVGVNDGGIPTGQLENVESTAFDFRSGKPIGESIEATGTTPAGYDHCYVIDRESDALTMAAAVYDPNSGRTMDVLTTQPGIQFYTANWMDGGAGSGGFEKHSAFALETQHYPDSPNQPDFPSTLLEPGQTFHQKTVFKFGIR